MKKKRLVSLLSLGAVITIALGTLPIYFPVSYFYDGKLIEVNPEYSVTRSVGETYTTLSNGRDDFKIIGFTDTHLDTYRKKSAITLEMMIRNITNEKPDLVVFDGDVITSSFNRRRAKQFANVMDKLGVYWTAVLGNHEGDNQWSVSREELLKIYAKSKYCLIETNKKSTKDGSLVDGLGNHVLNIADSKGKITQSIYLLDSGAYMSADDLSKYKDEIADLDNNRYDYLKESQIKWYGETVKDIEVLNGNPVKSMMFIHIPLPEYKTAYEEITGESEVTNIIPDYSVKDDGNQIIFGARRETICHSGHNSGMFNTIKELGSTQAVIAGHDHINNFVLSYQGVRLGYCQSSGYSSYNVVTRGMEKALLKGYSRFTVHNDGNLDWENVCNADIWPELQEDILKMYK